MKTKVLKIAFFTLFVAHEVFAFETGQKAMNADNLDYRPLGFSLGLGTLDKPKGPVNASEKLMNLSHLPDCHGGTLSTLSPQVKGVIDLSFDAFLKNSCEKLRGYQINRFTKAQCKAAVECKNIIKNKSEESADKIDAVLNKIIAKDFAKNTLINGAPKEESEKVAELMKGREFKKADRELQAQMFLAAIGKDADGKRKDAILDFDLSLLANENDFLDSPLFKKLLASKNKEIKKVFEDYRQERAAKIADEFIEKMLEKTELNDEAKCKEFIAFKNICTDVSALLRGNRANVKNAALLESLSSRKRMDENEASALKSVLGTDLDPSDLETMINARRCLSFTLETTGEPLAYGPFRGQTSFTPDFGLPSSGTGDSTFSNGSSISSGGNLGSVRSSGVYNGGDAPGEMYTPPYENGGGHLPSIDTNGGLIPSNPSSVGNNPGSSIPSGVGSAVEMPKTIPPVQGDLPAGVENKISTLEKQLEEARKKLESMENEKEEKAKGDEARERDKMKEMIAGLEAQVKAAKEALAQKPTPARREQDADDDGDESDRSGYSERGRGYDNYEPLFPRRSNSDYYPRSEKTVSAHREGEEGEGEKGKSSSSSPASPLSLSLKPGASSANASSSVTILDLGGLSKDKADALIMTQIQESKNQSFLITVNNEVKEVVPYEENGKVLFRTIIRGKIGDARFPTWKFKVTSKELPDEEKKRRSGAYLELNQTLQNGLLNSN